ncbi:MAG: hypothetical protein OCC45_11490 [Desulfotalea sp.]
MPLDPTLTIIALIISGIALLVALGSCFASKKANKISQESLAESKKNHEFQNRPWLAVSMVKNKKTRRYYDIEKSNGSIYW